MELLKEKWSGKINEAAIGRGEGAVKVGGQSGLPFLFGEGQMPNQPRLAMEVWDVEPADWPELLKEPFGPALKDPEAWAKKCVDEFGADLVALTLMGGHSEWGNKPAADLVKVTKDVLAAVDVPLIIRGCGDREKDNDVLVKVSEAAKGANCLFGVATQDNYKTLTAACLADGHCIIAESPIDVNIAKQVNILVTDMGFDINKIVMHPSTAALGYGMEYVYSIMERARLAALAGDRMLAMPLILFIGEECWRVKEAKGKKEEHPDWGSERERGPLWETVTASCMLQSGADILVLRHPKAVSDTKEFIKKLMER